MWLLWGQVNTWQAQWCLCSTFSKILKMRLPNDAVEQPGNSCDLRYRFPYPSFFILMWSEILGGWRGQESKVGSGNAIEVVNIHLSFVYSFCAFGFPSPSCSSNVSQISQLFLLEPRLIFLALTFTFICL